MVKLYYRVVCLCHHTNNMINFPKTFSVAETETTAMMVTLVYSLC